MEKIMLDYEKHPDFKYKEKIDWTLWNSRKNSFELYKRVESERIYGNHIKNTPKYSIMIPTYKRSDLLQEALESAINQEGYNEPYEIVVVDNDSEEDEGTHKLMANYCNQYSNIVYYRNAENIGMYGNWNRCIELCTTPWLCLLHDDDLLEPEYLKTIESFSLGEDVGILFNEQKIMDETEIQVSNSRKNIAWIREFINKIKENKKAKVIPWEFPRTASSCATLYNKNICIECGGFDDGFDPSCDWIFWGKVSCNYKVLRTGKRLSSYRFLCNGFLKPEIQRFVLIYSLIFAKKYFEYRGFHSKKVRKKYSQYTVRVYKNLVTGNPREKIFYTEILKELVLDKKYYKERKQKMIYAGYLIREGIEKLFLL